MISDEERRKVAANLRDSAENIELMHDAFLEEILAGDTGFAFGEDIPIDELLRHIADLIEPMRTDEEAGDSWGQIYDDMCPRDNGMTFEEFERRCKALGEGK